MNKLLVAIFLLMLISCKGISTKPKFLVIVPDGWVRKDTVVSTGDSVTYLRSINSTEAAGIHVAFAPDTDKFIKLLIANLRSRCLLFEFEGEGITNLHNKPVKWIKFKASYKSSKVPVNQKFYFIRSGSYLLDVSFTVSRGNVSEIQPVIEEVLSSIKFK